MEKNNKTYSMKTFLKLFGLDEVKEILDRNRTGDYYFKHKNKFYKHAAMFPGKNIREIDMSMVPTEILGELVTVQYDGPKTHFTMTELLNLECSKTGESIAPGDLVLLHNWGNDDSPIGFGRFVWNEDRRSFDLTQEYDMDRHAGFVSLDIDPYDMFRTKPEKMLIDMSESLMSDKLTSKNK